MTRLDDTQEQQIDAPSTGGSILLQSVFAGVVTGTVANVITFYLGYSIWIALLCHSVFGALGMGLVLVLFASRSEPIERKVSPKAMPRAVSTARH